MASLPVVSGRRAVRAFEKAGWKIARQRGSHIIAVILLWLKQACWQRYQSWIS
jgi:hypothetical protein